MPSANFGRRTYWEGALETMKRVLILVEGQTEERFVKDVLQPHLLSLGIAPQPKLVTTKRVKAGKHFKGGVTQFKKIEDDLRRLLGDTGAILVTTMLDFYGFPKDFTGWQQVVAKQPHQRVQQLEQALAAHFNHQRFCPYLMLHEYEAMLFAAPQVTARTLNHEPLAARMQEIRDACTGPEKIDEGEETAPSKRILELFPRYRKPLHGPLAVGRISLPQVRAVCPHFNGWLAALEKL